MHRKRPANPKNLENQAEIKPNSQKKVKTNQEETLKLNLLIDEVP